MHLKPCAGAPGAICRMGRTGTWAAGDVTWPAQPAPAPASGPDHTTVAALRDARTHRRAKLLDQGFLREGILRPPVWLDGPSGLTRISTERATNC